MSNKTIIWLYSSRLYPPEQGGTERITCLTQVGLSARGYHCMDTLVVTAGTGEISYMGEMVTDIYSFLLDNKVDVVINQNGIGHTELDIFLEKGGKRWQKEGGKIITCLHYAPVFPHNTARSLWIQPNKSLKDWLRIPKFFFTEPKRKRRYFYCYTDTFNQLYDASDYMTVLSASYIPEMERVMRRSHLTRLHVINNPLTFSEISSPEILNHKENEMLVVARFEDWTKRISLVLKAWRDISYKLPSWKLTIVGDGPCRDQYERYISKNHLLRVSLEGRQKPEHYYSRASIFLMTSSFEGWGQTLTEAQERGCVPVVMDSTTAFHDIIQNGENGILTPNNHINYFCTALLHLANDDAYRNRLALSGLKSVERFTLDKVMDQWEEIL